MKQVLILLAIFLAVRFFKRYMLASGRAANDPGPAKGSQPEKEGEEMVLDTVCNSYIPLSSALKVYDAGRTEYFCTDECRDKFLASK
jgi:YHS domain-containing protein